MRTRILMLKPGADLDRLQSSLRGLGIWTQGLTSGQDDPRALTIEPHSRRVPDDVLASLEGVQSLLASPSDTPKLDALAGQSIQVGKLAIGGGAPPVLAAGPCSAESPELVLAAAADAARSGARLLRGGAFKPRTSPYAFSGCGAEALGWLREAANVHSLGLVTEVMSERDVDSVGAVADLLQVGSRNMANFALLREVGRVGKPVLLKRGRAASLEDWRQAAEHLLHGGASGVIFCERGVAGVGDQRETRNTLDISAVALLKQVERAVVWVDPSHAAGRRDLILPLSRAALAAGADGLLIEAHPEARIARSDGAQALSSAELERLGEELFV